MFSQDEFYICDHSRQEKFPAHGGAVMRCADCGQHLWEVHENGGLGWFEAGEEEAGEAKWWADSEGFL